MFNAYNRVIVAGNQTRDIDLRTIPSGAQVGEFGLAVNERVKKGNEYVDDTTFVDVTAWQKTAEFIQRFGGKGKTVLIEGRLKMDKWVDKASGQNRSKLKIVADSVTFFDSKGKEEGSSNRAPASNGTPYATDPSGFDEAPPF